MKRLLVGTVSSKSRDGMTSREAVELVRVIGFSPVVEGGADMIF